MERGRAFNLILIIATLLIYCSCQSELIESKRKFNALITPDVETLTVDAGETAYLPVKVKNRGSRLWEQIGANPVHLSYHLLDLNGKVLIFDNSRTVLLHDLEPGDSINMRMTIDALDPGNYVLEIDMVKELITWFKDQGSRTVKVRVVAEN